MAPRLLVRWSVALAAIVLIVSGVAVAQTPRRGGVLHVGNLGEPPALDAHWTTASITETLTNHIYEGLYTLEMRLKVKSASVLISLAVPNNFGAIYPREIVEKFPPEVKVTEYVGTGPFKLAEWKPDQYIRMVRFDDYKPRNEKPNGYGGGKTPWLDEIRWIPVPEVATRVAQVETGELEFAD